KSDLARCCSVNKTWHATMIALVWKFIKLRGDAPKQFPPLSALTRHRHLVKNLYTRGSDIPPTYTGIHFPNLEKFAVSYSSPRMEIVNLSTLVELRMYSVDTGMQSSTVWLALMDAPQLRTLIISGGEILGDSLQSFTQLCARLQTVRLTMMTLLKGSSSSLSHIPTSLSTIQISSVSTPKLRTLVLKGICGMNTSDQLEWMLHFPTLKKLCWNVYPSEGQAQVLRRYMEDKAGGNRWPDLECLRLDSSMAEDEDLAAILQRIRRLTWLSVEASYFGPRSALIMASQHASTIKILNIAQCQHVTGGMVAKLLKSCTQLRELTCGRVLAQDFLNEDQVDAKAEAVAETKAAEWGCTKTLRSLKIGFEFAPSFLSSSDNYQTGADANSDHEETEVEKLRQNIEQRQHQIFQKLSMFTSLSILKTDISGAGRLQCGLDFRLSKGLEQLSTLKRLSVLDFGYTKQCVGTEEVNWIFQHWRNLHTIRGKLNMDADVDSEVSGLLSSRCTV
ncbi:hypothetical protein BGZ58_007452, partial [Dissophora ornata]